MSDSDKSTEIAKTISSSQTTRLLALYQVIIFSKVSTAYGALDTYSENSSCYKTLDTG